MIGLFSEQATLILFHTHKERWKIFLILPLCRLLTNREHDYLYERMTISRFLGKVITKERDSNSEINTAVVAFSTGILIGYEVIDEAGVGEENMMIGCQGWQFHVPLREKNARSMTLLGRHSRVSSPGGEMPPFRVSYYTKHVKSFARHLTMINRLQPMSCDPITGGLL